MTDTVLSSSALANRRPLTLGRVLAYATVLVSLVILLFPVLWMMLTAFKTSGEVFRVPPQWLPENWALEPLAFATSPQMVRFFINSIVVAALTSTIATIIGGMIAYVISRSRHWSASALLMLFLASMAFPIPLLMITLYSMLSSMNLLDTYAAVVIGHLLLTLPLVVWLMKGFIDGLPAEVELSAYIDGAGPFCILMDIVLPMMKPGMAASAIYVFVTSWNEFVFGLTFTTSTDMRPLPAGISLLLLQEFQYKWPEMMAVAMVATIPILALFIFFQRYFIEGITAGAVKH